VTRLVSELPRSWADCGMKIIKREGYDVEVSDDVKARKVFVRDSCLFLCEFFKTDSHHFRYNGEPVEAMSDAVDGALPPELPVFTIVSKIFTRRMTL
jgi:hypothetical protein